MRKPAVTIAAVCLALLPGLAGAACPDDAAVSAFVSEYLAKRPAQAFPLDSLADARCAQDKVVAGLTPQLGPATGWKIGLTAAPIQAMFGATEPVRGRLFIGAILPDGATVPARFGSVPIWEADLLATIKSAAIMQATTAVEVAAALESITPFVELADLALAEGQTLDARTITAINVGARGGIAGTPIPVTDPAGMAERLAAMQVVAIDDHGTEISRAPGAAILGQPLNALLWLVADLNKAGLSLRPGDVVSLGAFSRPLGPAAGRAVTIRYEGLGDSPSLRFRFE